MAVNRLIMKVNFVLLLRKKYQIGSEPFRITIILEKLLLLTALFKGMLEQVL